MAVRLVWLAHGATAGLRRSVFGDDTPLEQPRLVAELDIAVRSVSRGPELACAQTVAGLGVAAVTQERLASPDPGSWRGLSVPEVAVRDPEGLAAWLVDPSYASHGGETLAELVARVGDFCDQPGWSDGRHLLVVTPMVARAAAVHAVGADPRAMFRIDVAPSEQVRMSRSADTWRLTGLG